MPRIPSPDKIAELQTQSLTFLEKRDQYMDRLFYRPDLNDEERMACLQRDVLGSGGEYSIERFNEMRAAHPGWKPDFAEMDLPGQNFAGINLKRARIAFATLIHKCLDESDLSDIDAEQAELDHSSFIDAKLKRASMIGASLVGAYCSRADMSGANLTETICANANFEGARLCGADFLDAILDGANFEGADLRRVKNLTPDQLSRTCFYGARFDDPELVREAVALLVKNICMPANAPDRTDKTEKTGIALPPDASLPLSTGTFDAAHEIFFKKPTATTSIGRRIWLQAAVAMLRTNEVFARTNKNHRCGPHLLYRIDQILPIFGNKPISIEEQVLLCEIGLWRGKIQISEENDATNGWTTIKMNAFRTMKLWTQIQEQKRESMDYACRLLCLVNESIAFGYLEMSDDMLRTETLFAASMFEQHIQQTSDLEQAAIHEKRMDLAYALAHSRANLEKAQAHFKERRMRQEDAGTHGAKPPYPGKIATSANVTAIVFPCEFGPKPFVKKPGGDKPQTN